MGPSEKDKKVIRLIHEGYEIKQAMEAAGFKSTQSYYNRIKKCPICNEYKRKLERMSEWNTVMSKSATNEWLSKIMLLDPADIVEISGNSVTVKSLDSIPEDVRRLIEGIEPTEWGIKFKIPSKLGAAQLLSKNNNFDKTEDKNPEENQKTEIKVIVKPGKSDLI